MKDKALRKCPKCAKNTLERLIGTGAAVIFKGSGFYQTDYRSEAYKQAAQADAPKPADGAAATAEPAAKPDPAPAKTDAASEKAAPARPVKDRAKVAKSKKPATKG